MLEEAQLVGYLVLGVITLGSFITIVWKFTQPINELRVVIQKLNDNIDSLKNDNSIQNKRLDKHGQEIDNLDKNYHILDGRVGKLEDKIKIYHKE